MKKNKMMRVASALLIAVLLTTSAISGTFAKYVSTGHAEDIARVAKWGIVVKAGGSLFSDAYVKTTGNYPVAWDEDKMNDLSFTVSTAADDPDNPDNIVAPGTKSADGMFISLSGQPEVAMKLEGKVAASDIYLDRGLWAVMSDPFKFEDADASKLEFDQFVTAKKLYILAGADTSDPTDDTYTCVVDGDALDPDAFYALILHSCDLNERYYPVLYSYAGNDYQAVDLAKYIAENLIKGGLMADGATEYAITSPNNYNAQVLSYATMEADQPISVEYTFGLDSSDNDYAVYYPANTELTEGELADEAGKKITWEWVFDGNDDADTILGDLMAEYTSGAAVNYKVVYAETAGDGTPTVYYSTYQDGGDPILSGARADTQFANLKTGIEIALTFTQVD